MKKVIDYRLTDLGIENSGRIKKHVKYGEYITWNEKRGYSKRK